MLGRVQGVFYRARAQKKANDLGLAGWVKNNPDGSVTACAQGPENKIKDFIEWCKKGPDSADVKEIKSEWQNPSSKYENFSIV